MYELSDSKAAIKEVQKFLHTVSVAVNPDVPRIAIDGIYGEETVEAVRIFQLLYGLPNTGYVDLHTFDMLYFLYSEAVNDKANADYIITDVGFPIKLGNQGKDVIAIHLYITELLTKYPDIGAVRQSSYFSEDTRNAVINLQKIFNLPPTGEIDFALYQRIITEVDSIQRLRDIYL